jgi:predicted negative regulator of RcsB-dependent stress response
VADRTEEEQVEAIKKWWDENGTSTVVGIIAALLVVFGYRGWESHVQEQGEMASAVYEDLLQAVSVNSPFEMIDDERLSTGQFLAKKLKDEHPDSVYAHMGALFMAKLAVDQDDLSKAEQELKWTLDNDIDESLEVVVKTRLARIRLAQGKPEEALQIVSGLEGGAHKSSVEEVIGDIHVEVGDLDQAREAYQRAVNALEEGDERQYLEMKLDNLVAPAVSVQAEDMSAAEEESMEEDK